MKNAVEDPTEGLTRLVPDEDYKAAFLKLTRSLSPTGKVFSQMEIVAAGDPIPVVLVPESRKAIAQTLKAEAPPSSDDMEPTVVKGVLRGVHLDQEGQTALQRHRARRPVALAQENGSNLDRAISTTNCLQPL